MRHLVFVMIVMSTNCISGPCDLTRFYEDPTAGRGEPRFIDSDKSDSAILPNQGGASTVACAGCGGVLALALDGTFTRQGLPSSDYGDLAGVAADPDGGTYVVYGNSQLCPDNLVAFDASGDMRWQVEIDVSFTGGLYATHDGVYLVACNLGTVDCTSVSGYAARDGSPLAIGAPAMFYGFTATSDALYFSSPAGIVQAESGAVTWTRGPEADLLTPLANGGVAATGGLDGTLDLGGTTVTATQGAWYAEWGADGTLAWAVGVDNDDELDPTTHSRPTLAAAADQLIIASLNSPTFGSAAEIHVVNANGLAASYAVSSSASAYLEMYGLVPAGDGSLWMEIQPDPQCTSDCATQLQFGSHTWTDKTASVYLVNFLP